MKKETSLKNPHNLTTSAALVRDIEYRYTHGDLVTTTKQTVCAACGKLIPAHSKVWNIPTYNHKGKIVTCSQDCTDTAQYAELQRFGCENLEDIPMIRGKKNPLSRQELISEYEKRQSAYTQDAVDKIFNFREKYQLIRPME